MEGPRQAHLVLHRRAVAAGLVPLVFLLSGCVRIDQRLQVNSDGTGSMLAEITTAKNPETERRGCNAGLLSGAEQVPGVDVSVTETRSTCVTQLTIEFSRPEELQTLVLRLPGMQEGGAEKGGAEKGGALRFALTHDRTRWSFETNAPSAWQAKSPSPLLGYNLTVTLPGQISDTNATRHDESTANWELNEQELTSQRYANLFVTSTDADPVGNVFTRMIAALRENITALLAAFSFAVLVAYMLSRRRRADTHEEPNDDPYEPAGDEEVIIGQYGDEIAPEYTPPYGEVRIELRSEREMLTPLRGEKTSDTNLPAQDESPTGTAQGGWQRRVISRNEETRSTGPLNPAGETNIGGQTGSDRGPEDDNREQAAPRWDSERRAWVYVDEYGLWVWDDVISEWRRQ